MLKRLFSNHVLANLTIVLVLIQGGAAYRDLPREQDPEVNFNWISVTTLWPGSSAGDVEKLITDPLEEAIERVPDIKFVSSYSREGFSDILVRFGDIDPAVFEKRLSDLRREVRNKADEVHPDDAETPFIMEITSASAFPAALLIVVGSGDEEVLRSYARNVEQDIERLKGVNRADPTGLNDPEIHVSFSPDQLQQFGINPVDLANGVQSWFRDVAAGSAEIGDQDWLIRLTGTSPKPGYLTTLPVPTANGQTLIGSVANVSLARRDPSQIVRYRGRPAVLLAVIKKSGANTLDLLDRVKSYIADKNPSLGKVGMKVVLLDDQTSRTREALDVMQTNAIYGLLLVMLVTWLFLGPRIAFFIGLGIPFTLAGLFWVLKLMDQTLNVSVLLGIVIVLGMLVDDAVVVVESIYYRLQRGASAMAAAVESLQEIAIPVTSAVLTTIAAFLPLMLMSGVIGQFMFVIPLVVTTALLISLLESFWMLPVHAMGTQVSGKERSRSQRLRENLTHRLRMGYVRALVKVLRHPVITSIFVALLVLMTVGALAGKLVRVEFFADDPLRLFYVNVETSPGTILSQTMDYVDEVEQQIRDQLDPAEVREIASYSGVAFTPTGLLVGDRYGQIAVSLVPRREHTRSVDQVINSIRDSVLSVPGPNNITFLRLTGGPPTLKPVSIKVRGDDFEEIRAATDELRDILAGIPGIKDISDDDSGGKQQLEMHLNADAIKRAGLAPETVGRMLHLLFDGEIVATMQHQGEELAVRVKAAQKKLSNIDDILRLPLSLTGGGEIAIGQLVDADTKVSPASIRHYNFRRAITLEADLDKQIIDTVEANQKIRDQWQQLRERYPSVNLDFTGELDDIKESLDSMGLLFLFGIGLIYLILGTQFNSYFQPLLIMATIPIAFTGVVLGLIVSGNPLSLYTLYGVVALTGIVVNSAIVLIAAANGRIQSGMSLLHATVYAGRRRVIPVIITSLTTIAGLFSLAVGIGGKSLLWGPVAAAIVWGLGVATFLTLFLIPLLYRLFMRRGQTA